MISPGEPQRILEMGAGAGQIIAYMANRYPLSKIDGVEINPDLVQTGNKYFRKHSLNQCALYHDDLYNLKTVRLKETEYQGVMSICTLSWLPGFERALEAMVRVNTDYIGLTSMFFEGRVNSITQIEDWTRPMPISGKLYTTRYFNTYSLPLVRDHFAKLGYKSFEYSRFEIDIDIEKPKEPDMGTYTERLKDGRRLQISGPLLMSWYFVVARKQ